MSNDNNNKWNVEPAPPSPLYFGEKEINIVKQLNDEYIERIQGQQILYFPIDYEITDFHKLYREAIVKNFLPPVRVYAMVTWEGQETVTSNYDLDKISKIIINFHKKRLTEDQNLYVREGDFVKYGDYFYEILTLEEPKQLWGQISQKFEISAKCAKSRKGVFYLE